MLFRPTYDFYRLTPLRAAALAAFVLNVVGLAAIGFLGVQWIRRVRRPAAQRLAAGAATATLLASLNFARMSHEAVGRWTDVIGWRGLLALVALALAAALIWPHPTTTPGSAERHQGGLRLGRGAEHQGPTGGVPVPVIARVG